jgi:hypothetical protein
LVNYADDLQACLRPPRSPITKIHWMYNDLLLLSTCRFSIAVTRAAFSFVFCSTMVRRKALSDLAAAWAFSIALSCSKMAEDIGGSAPGVPGREALSAWIISDDMLFREPDDLL